MKAHVTWLWVATCLALLVIATVGWAGVRHDLAAARADLAAGREETAALRRAFMEAGDPAIARHLLDVTTTRDAVTHDGGSATTAFKLDSTGPLILEAGGGSGAVTLDSSGQVGIGVTAPSEMLDVAGNGKLSGSITVGSVVFSDGSTLSTSPPGGDGCTWKSGQSTTGSWVYQSSTLSYIDVDTTGNFDTTGNLPIYTITLTCVSHCAAVLTTLYPPYPPETYPNYTYGFRAYIYGTGADTTTANVYGSYAINWVGVQCT